VEGVKDTFYSKELRVREIQDSSKRVLQQMPIPVLPLHLLKLTRWCNTKCFIGLDWIAVTETINWIDDRDPAIKIGYDETNQRLTFDGVNGQIGKGTGVGFDLFTVYSKKLDAGENSLGIEAFGNNKDIDLRTDDIPCWECFCCKWS
jgi:flagellar hook protein FlgE